MNDLSKVEVKVLLLEVEINGEVKKFKRGDIIDLPKAKVRQLGLSVAKYVPQVVDYEEVEDDTPAPGGSARIADSGAGAEPPKKRR